MCFENSYYSLLPLEPACLFTYAQQIHYSASYVVEVFWNICQESLKKFREEAEKLEKSESLQKAREKYVCLLLVLRCVFISFLQSASLCICVCLL